MKGVLKGGITISLLIVTICLTSLTFAQPSRNLDVIHEKTYNVSSGEKLTIKTSPGDIKVESWSKNEVFVKVWGNENAKELEFTFDYSGGEVYIEAEREKNSWWGRNKIRLYYEVMVPEKFDVNLKTSGGDIGVFEVEGMLNAATSGGDIGVKGHTGNIDVATSGGDINISNSKGAVDAGTSGGDVFITTTEGSIDAGTSGGDVIVEYDGENMGIDLATSGGDITVRVPDNFKADIELRTSGGRVSCDLSNLSVRTKTKYKLIGEINGGGYSIDASTSGGDVEIEPLR